VLLWLHDACTHVWLNAGVAPIYKEYKLAVQLRSQVDQAVIRVPADVTKWLPGDSVVDESFYIPANLTAGSIVYLSAFSTGNWSAGHTATYPGRQPDGCMTWGPSKLRNSEAEK